MPRIWDVVGVHAAVGIGIGLDAKSSGWLVDWTESCSSRAAVRRTPMSRGGRSCPEEMTLIFGIGLEALASNSAVSD